MHRIRRSAAKILIATTLLSATCSQCMALGAEDISTPATNQLTAIENITNEIVRAEIQLMKLSTEFHVSWMKPNKWKSWRIFAYKLSGSGLTNAGMITIAASRFKYLDNPSDAPLPFLKAGHIINLTAASVLLGGTLLETALDRLTERRFAKAHLDCKSALSSFSNARSKLDALIAQRKKLLSSSEGLSDKQREILEADGDVLSDLRELISKEFARSYSDVAHYRGTRDLANLTTAFGASTAGYMGSLNSLLSVSNHRPRQTAVAGSGFITSGASVVVAPLLTKFGSDFAVKRAEATLRKNDIDVPENVADNFDVHRQKLDDLIAKVSPDDMRLMQALQARQSAYSIHNNIFDGRHNLRLARKAQAKRELKGRLFFSSIVGGTNIARGTQLAVAGLNYYDEPSSIFKLVASASTCYIVGSGVWTADNIQGKVREELSKRKTPGGKLSVHAKLIEDLGDLDDMEDSMAIY